MIYICILTHKVKLYIVLFMYLFLYVFFKTYFVRQICKVNELKLIKKSKKIDNKKGKTSKQIYEKNHKTTF